MDAKLSVRGVRFHYGTRLLLDNLHFHVREREFISVVGQSGVGKSTLFKLLAGLYQPEAGEILLADGSHLLGRVGYMPQEDLLLPWRTVVQNAALPLELKGIGKQAAREQVTAKLAAFGLDSYANVYPHELSGGMRQRVSLLRASLTGADLLLLDEPFSALDGITRREMQEWLLNMWQQLDLTVMMITHDLEEAVLLADRIFVLPDTPISEIIELAVPRALRRQSDSRQALAALELRETLWSLLQEHRVRGVKTSG